MLKYTKKYRKAYKVYLRFSPQKTFSIEIDNYSYRKVHYLGTGFAFIDAHRGGKGGGMKQHPPRQIFEKLVNKNAIKRKIGGHPLAIFPETLDPPLGILAKTSRTPSPGFSTRVHLCLPWTFI